jgi:hypothetical protein
MKGKKLKMKAEAVQWWEEQRANPTTISGPRIYHFDPETPSPFALFENDFLEYSGLDEELARAINEFIQNGKPRGILVQGSIQSGIDCLFQLLKDCARESLSTSEFSCIDEGLEGGEFEDFVSGLEEIGRVVFIENIDLSFAFETRWNLKLPSFLREKLPKLLKKERGNLYLFSVNPDNWNLSNEGMGSLLPEIFGPEIAPLFEWRDFEMPKWTLPQFKEIVKSAPYKFSISDSLLKEIFAFFIERGENPSSSWSQASTALDRMYFTGPNARSSRVIEKKDWDEYKKEYELA